MRDWGLTRQERWGLLMAGFLLPVAAATVARLMLAPPRAPAPAQVAASASIPCDPTRFSAGGAGYCAAGSICVAGSCRALLSEGRCAATGERCLTGSCEPGLELQGGRCVRPEEARLAAWMCRGSAEWERTIVEMRRVCAQEAGERDASLTATRCGEALWERVNRTSEGFERGLLELPETFSVHFPNAEPREARGASRWPDPATRAFYKSALAERARTGRLAEARVIFVIGRASVQSGTEAVNEALALRRADLVAALLGELLAGDVKILRWAMASKFRLPLSEFQRGGHPAPVAWDEAASSRLRARFVGEEVAVSPADAEALDEEINRVALVVPLACDGTELFPRPSFRGRLGARRGDGRL
ncbi:MAG: hypothetical protein IPK80_13275 [Nannocystis sp.]|nr:hypothetical protein [Nannocystis sp.]